MKTNEEIAHIWANGLDYKGQQGSLFFNRHRPETIYSYGSHFAIAKHLDADNVLFTTRSYSNSTAKHINFVRQAVSHKNIIYCWNPDAPHSQNIHNFVTEILFEKQKLAKAKKPEKYLIEIESIKASLQKYLDYFKLKLTAKQKKDIAVENVEKLQEAYKIELKKQKEKKAKEVAKGGKLYAKYLKNFRAGVLSGLTATESSLFRDYRHSIGDPAFFKISGDEVISSQGVRIPKNVAKRYLDKLLAGELTNNDKVFGYQVREVDSNKVIIGCHNIYKSEIDYLAQNL